MSRLPRQTPARAIFHVINRSVGRHTIFHKPKEYQAFERVLPEARVRVPIRILAHALKPSESVA